MSTISESDTPKSPNPTHPAPDCETAKQGLVRAKKGLPVIILCLWRRRRDQPYRFVLSRRRLHAFARRAPSRLYHLSLDMPMRGMLQKGDRVALMGNFDGLYQVLTVAKKRRIERALLVRCHTEPFGSAMESTYPDVRRPKRKRSL